MIDLTPLDVRNKRGDFKKGMRGYDPQEVDVFLELVAERLEALVRENIQLRDRTRTLQEQVDAQAGREQAVQDALVTAQELRKDIRDQSQREADHVMREAESEARRIVSEAEAEARARVRSVERQIDHARDSLQDMERRRTRFLQEFRGLLQRELDVVEVEEERTPLEDRTIDLELGTSRSSASGKGAKAPEAGAFTAAAAGGSAAGPSDGEDVAGGDDAGSEPKDPAAGGEHATAGGEDATAGGGTTPDSARASDASEPERSASEPERDASGPEMPGGTQDGDSATAAAPEAVPGHRDQDLDSDVGELAGREDGGAARPSAPPPEVGEGPSSLELELMAGAAGRGASDDSDAGTESRGPTFPDVPDLETVLAEAGIDEVRPPDAEEISPPPAETSPEDRLALFEEDEEDGKR